jgi:hypothetical protein
MVGLCGVHNPGGDMKPDWEILAELGVFIDLDPDEEDIAAAAFDRLGFPRPAAYYAPDLVRQLVLDLERRREASVVVREYEDGLGLLYYDLDAADGDEDTPTGSGATPGARGRGQHQRHLRRAVALTKVRVRA